MYLINLKLIFTSKSLFWITVFTSLPKVTETRAPSDTSLSLSVGVVSCMCLLSSSDVTVSVDWEEGGRRGTR